MNGGTVVAKKTDKLVEKLRSDIQALSEAVWALKEHVRVEAAAEAAANGSKRDRSKKLDQREHQVDGTDGRGVMSSYGTFFARDRSGGALKMQWRQDNVSTESLMPDDLEMVASQLSAIGHRQRLNILLALLEQPASAGDLVSSLDLGTTGAAYHHLNVLQNAGFVVQEERGTYEIDSARIGTVIGILSALASESTVDVAQPDGMSG